jgi:hypothetical protein
LHKLALLGVHYFARPYFKSNVTICPFPLAFIVAGVAIGQIGLTQHAVLIESGFFVGMFNVKGTGFDDALLNRCGRLEFKKELRA